MALNSITNIESNHFAAEQENIYPGSIAKNMLCLHQSSKIELNGFAEVLN
jgi:hypothetical protein